MFCYFQPILNQKWVRLIFLGTFYAFLCLYYVCFLFLFLNNNANLISFYFQCVLHCSISSLVVLTAYEAAQQRLKAGSLYSLQVFFNTFESRRRFTALLSCWPSGWEPVDYNPLLFFNIFVFTYIFIFRLIISMSTLIPCSSFSWCNYRSLCWSAVASQRQQDSRKSRPTNSPVTLFL